MNSNQTIVIDNYDSFTYNLVQMIEEINGIRPDVYRNDEISVEDVARYNNIVLSPGPGLPSESGNLLEIIKQHSNSKRILGVCLGLQAIAEVFGSKLKNLGTVYHGIQTKVIRTDEDSVVLNGLPDSFDAGRYHSWVIDPESVGSELLITSYDEAGQIMSARHKTLEVYGVQFHPESILTPIGNQILQNFFNAA